MAKHFDARGNYIHTPGRKMPNPPSRTNPDPDGQDSINLTGDAEDEKPKIVRLTSSKSVATKEKKEKKTETVKTKRSRKISEKIQGSPVAPIEGAEGG